METSWAGPAAVVLFVGWLAYYVPTRLSMRQQVVDGRVDDRFSGGLRVVAVADGSGRTTPAARRRLAERTDRHAEDPTPSSGVPLLRTARPATGALPVVRPGVTGAPVGIPAGAAARAAAAEAERRRARRAAAARRRMVVALVLLAACAGVVVGAALGVLPWPVLAAPAALLGAVVVLGRRAVVAARRADEARMTAARARAAAARRAALGGPVSPRNASARLRVTGLAVPASHAPTQMIPRVEAPVGHPAARDVRPASAGVSARAVRAALAAAAPDATPDAAVAVDESSLAAGGRPWEPVPVPPPTYTLKPAAGRPAPSPAAPLPEPLPEPVPVERLAGLAAPGVVAAPGTGSAGAPAGPDGARLAAPANADDAPAPATDTLGLSLDAILARRRAAGE